MSAKDTILKILRKIVPEAKETDIVVPENRGAHYATTIAFKLAKEQGRNPAAIAAALVRDVKENAPAGFFEKVESAGPGFVNFYLTPAALNAGLLKVLKEKKKFGTGSPKKEKIQVEFVSANPTGPLTLGNGRGGVYGDVLANVLKFSGYKVTKEYYFNDAGGQITSLGRSILGVEPIEYRGEYIDNLKKKIKGSDPKVVGEKAAGEILKTIKKTVRDGMGIKMDVWFSEKTLHRTGAVKKNLEWLKKKDLAYEKDGALWFRAAKFGDEKDRVLLKSDGEPTYFAVDFAYHRNKFLERKFDRVINVWGTDHHGDVPRIMAAAEVLGAKDKLTIILMQFVHLVQNGQAVRMSKRKGLYVTVDELLKEVGRDVFRFFSLMVSANTHVNFDLALAKEQSNKNPVYYVQYSYVRAKSVIKKAGRAKVDPKALALLNTPEDEKLIRQILEFPAVIEAAAKDYQVHHLARYALDLAKDFQQFYEKERVIGERQDVKNARLALVQATAVVLENLFTLLGISAPSKM